MRQVTRLVTFCCTLGLVSSVGCLSQPEKVDEPAVKILGVWEMIEDKELPRHNAPKETVEFTKDRRFVSFMNGKVEMEGTYRIEDNKLTFMDINGKRRLGTAQLIKRLTSESLVLADSQTGREDEFTRKRP
jgi:uncharacterized protein (TIGR03066 family)